MDGRTASHRARTTRRGAHSAAAAAGAALAILLGGCGSVTAHVSGRRVFVQDCQFCHSVNGHPVPEQQGGDLRGLPMTRTELIQSTAGMPKLHGPLTGPEIRAVVAYLQSLRPR
ncbi:MAG TPA: cytochrome c [Solirubrobacteraceae bacterium]|nr:cytochrome c [Solirubrobacteraceae bacterium]